jgi:hypothetical protein
MKIVVGTLLTLILTLGLWAFIYKTYPMFVAEEALAKSAELGVLTPELEVEIRADDFKSSLMVYTAWGMILGLIGAIAAGLGEPKLYIRGIAGFVLGGAVGALTNYLTEQYAMRSEPPVDPMQYWLIRITSVHLLLVAVAAIAASIGHPVTDVASRLVKAVIALVFAACVFSLLMGLVTPIEQSQYNYVQFPASSMSLLLSINLLVYLALAVTPAKKGGAAVSTNEISSQIEKN